MPEYELKVCQKQAEMRAYQLQVHEHYDQTANLFKNMVGSYKALFDHLFIRYEQLGNLSDRRIPPKCASALLDGPCRNN